MSRTTKAKSVDVNELGVLFEALRAFAYDAMSSEDDPHKRYFLIMLADRGDELLGDRICVHGDPHSFEAQQP
jgi:hypothetical protein